MPKEFKKIQQAVINGQGLNNADAKVLLDIAYTHANAHMKLQDSLYLIAQESEPEMKAAIMGFLVKAVLPRSGRTLEQLKQSVKEDETPGFSKFRLND